MPVKSRHLIEAKTRPHLPLEPRVDCAIAAKRYSHARGLYQGGHYRTAEIIFAQLLEACPLNAAYWFGLASSLQQQNDYQNARCAWNMALILDSKNPAPCFHAAECNFSLGSLDDGLKALQIAETRLRENWSQTWKEKISTLKTRWTQQQRSA